MLECSYRKSRASGIRTQTRALVARGQGASVGWGLPMSTPQFNVGDRVQTRAAGVVVGTQGTIHQAAHAMPDAYLVLFDGWAEPCLMQAGDLGLIDDADPSERARGT